MATLDERYSQFRENIEHEDANAHNRVNWALIFHGLLFTAFVAGASLLEKLTICFLGWNGIGIGLGLVCALGIGSGVAAFFGVWASEKQLRILTLWWEDICPAPDASLYPPYYKYEGMLSYLGTSAAFILLSVVWSVMLYIVCCSQVTVKPETPSDQSSAAIKLSPVIYTSMRMPVPIPLN